MMCVTGFSHLAKTMQFMVPVSGKTMSMGTVFGDVSIMIILLAVELIMKIIDKGFLTVLHN
jgi:hypothetical protein